MSLLLYYGSNPFPNTHRTVLFRAVSLSFHGCLLVKVQGRNNCKNKGGGEWIHGKQEREKKGKGTRAKAS